MKSEKIIIILNLLFKFFSFSKGNHVNTIANGVSYYSFVENKGENIIMIYSNKLAFYDNNMLNFDVIELTTNYENINICQLTNSKIIIINNKTIYSYNNEGVISLNEDYIDTETTEFMVSCIKDHYFLIAFLNGYKLNLIKKGTNLISTTYNGNSDLSIHKNIISCTALTNYIVCFYINSGDRRETNYILYNLSLSIIKTQNLKQGVSKNNDKDMIEPKGECDTEQIKSMRIKDDSFLLGILKNQTDYYYLYAVTAYADDTDIHKLSTKSNTGNFASTFPCTSSTISIGVINEFRFATLCKKGDNHLLSIIQINGDLMEVNDILMNKEIPNMIEQINLISLESIGLGILYRDSGGIKFTIPEYPLCEDIILPVPNSDSNSKIAINSEYTFNFEKIYTDILSISSSDNLLISVFPYDYKNNSHNSVKIYHDNELIPADIGITQKKYSSTNWKLISGKLHGDFHYTYQVYNSSKLGIKKCFLHIIISCQEGCNSCEIDSSGNESSCLECDKSKGYYLFVPGKTSVVVCEKNSTEINGYYLTEQGENGYFEECNEACAKCYGPYNTNCMTANICINNTCCNSNYYALEDKKNECYKEIPDGYYLSISENIFKKCPNYCKTCNMESNDGPICITCNSDIGYYPLLKYDFVLCYRVEEKPSGYYLDVDNEYKECSNACKKCSKGKSATNTNCDECNSDSYYYNDPTISGSFLNCVSNSTIIDNYYFDSGEFKKCPNKCLKCNSQSLSKPGEKCLKCNIDDKYYPLFNNTGYLTCIKEEDIEDGNYLDNENNIILKCYDACKTCSTKGTISETNCLQCKEGFKEHSQNGLLIHCIRNCPTYYYIFYNQYKCCDKCPVSYPYLDPSKGQCYHECPNVIYNKMCYDECPENTKLTHGNICINDDQCFSSYSYSNVYKEELSSTYYDSLIKEYLNEYSYTNNHISFIESNLDEYVISIYQNEECSNGENEKNLIMLDLVDCPNKLRTYYKFDDTIIFTILTINLVYKENSYEIEYYVYNSETQENIDLTPCSRINIIKKITDEVDINEASDMEKIGVNVFDINDDFFNNICFEFTYNGKDVILADRVKYFYQNISCGEGCSLNNVDIKNKNINCSCSVDESKDSFFDNKLTGELYQLFVDANFEVLKCYKEVFQFKFWIKNLGNFIILSLLFIHCVFVIIYSIKGLFSVKCYLYQFMKFNPPKKDLLTDNNNNIVEKEGNNNNINNNNFNRTEYISKRNIDFEEEKGDKSENGIYSQENINNKNNDNQNILNGNKKKKYKDLVVLAFSHKYFDDEESSIDFNMKDSINKIELKSEEKNSTDSLNNKRKTKLKKPKLESSIDFNKEKKKSKRTFENDELNNMSFENAIKYDKRKFCEYYWYQLKEKQSIINTFFTYTPMRPFSIKVIVFIFSISVIFALNCLFITESYISGKYTTTKNLGFAYILSNAINRIFYSVISSIIINYCISCLFDAELRVNSLIKREKDINILSKELNNVCRKMKINIIIFIICTFLLMAFFWYYLSAFCNCYHATQMDWFIGSLICIFFVQLYPFILCFLSTLLWYFGIKCKIGLLFRINHCLIN